jgi:predicted metal-dependent phosphoesterase TrpH
MGTEFLTDFHVHTNFSDGKLPLSEVIDLYGKQGFGAIAITDHIPERQTLIGKAAVYLNQVVTEDSYSNYLQLLEEEKERAWDQYQMVVIPGYELSKNHVANRRSAHIIGLGVRHYLYADGDPEWLAHEIRNQGGVAIAAHPVNTRKIEKQTYYLWDRREELFDCFDAWEVASGPHIFTEVADSKLPKIAVSDFHMPKHMTSWKTVMTCEKKEEAILQAIKKQQVSFRYYVTPPEILKSYEKKPENIFQHTLQSLIFF